MNLSLLRFTEQSGLQNHKDSQCNFSLNKGEGIYFFIFWKKIVKKKEVHISDLILITYYITLLLFSMTHNWKVKKVINLWRYEGIQKINLSVKEYEWSFELIFIVYFLFFMMHENQWATCPSKGARRSARRKKKLSKGISEVLA